MKESRNRMGIQIPTKYPFGLDRLQCLQSKKDIFSLQLQQQRIRLSSIIEQMK